MEDRGVLLLSQVQIHIMDQVLVGKDIEADVVSLIIRMLAVVVVPVR
jgi:hypothetical protein